MPKLLYDSVKLYNVILAEDEPDGDDVNKNINAFPQQTIKPTIHQTCFTNETSNQWTMELVIFGPIGPVIHRSFEP